MSEEIEGVDYVVCQICGNHFKQITQKHLNKHNITFRMYVEKYPNILTILDSVRVKIGTNHIDFPGLNAIENIDYVICIICGKKLKSINGVHLKLQGITLSKYKLLYPQSQTLCDTTHNNYVDCNIGSNNPFYGKTHTDERNKYMSDLLMGHTNTPFGKDNPFYGRKHTRKVLLLMSRNRKGKGIGNKNAGDVSGDKNPNWRGGLSFEKYPKDFNLIKPIILEIYDNRDYISGLPRIICNPYRALSIHHINYDKMNNNVDNLIPLSDKNHIMTNYKRNFWERLFKYSLGYEKEYYS